MTERAEHQAQAETLSKEEKAAKTEFARLLDKSVNVGEGGVEIKSLQDLERIGQWIFNSGVAPKGDRLADIVVKIQAGMEIGLTPMRALSCLTSINGRVGIMGDAARALVQSKHVLKPGTLFDVKIDGEGDKRVAIVQTWRKAWAAPETTRFSVADAKLAKLWGKGGPWTDYPERMLRYRALGFHLRDHYADVLMGLTVAEELQDFREVKSKQAKPEPPAAEQGPDPLLAGVTVQFDPALRPHDPAMSARISTEPTEEPPFPPSVRLTEDEIAEEAPQLFAEGPASPQDAPAPDKAPEVEGAVRRAARRQGIAVDKPLIETKPAPQPAPEPKSPFDF